MTARDRIVRGNSASGRARRTVGATGWLLVVLAVVLAMAGLPVVAVPVSAQVDPPPGGPALYDEEVLADGPVAYYRLGESSMSSAAVDASGNGQDGAFGAGVTAGVGGALLDDPDTAIESSTTAWAMTAPDLTLPVGNEPRTVEFWSTSQHDNSWLVQYGNRLGLYIENPDQIRVYFGPGSADYYVAQLPHSFFDGSWHHWALSSDADQRVALYLDGQEVWSRDDVTINQVLGTGLLVGQATGAYDEVAVYDKALGADRLAIHWARGLSRRAEDCPRPPSIPGEPVPAEIDNPYSQSVLADAPLSYLRLGELDDDPDTRVAFDYTGNCRHAAIATDATATAGPLLSAGDGAVEHPDNAHWVLHQGAAGFPSGPDPVTVELWSTSQQDNRWLFQYGDRFGLYIENPDQMRLYWGPGGADYNVVSLPHSFFDGAWHLWALSYDGSTLKLYLDGAQVAAVSGVVVNTAAFGGELVVGQATGAYDEVAVYPAALAPTRIAEHYTIARSLGGGACLDRPFTGHTQTILDDNPLLYWRLGETADQPDSRVAFDSSGNCRNGSHPAGTTGTTSGALTGDPDGAVSSPNDAKWEVIGSAAELPVGTNPVSVEFWSNSQHDNRWLFQYGDRLGLYIENPNQMRLYWGPGGADYNVVGLPYSFFDGEWHHWALTYDGTSLRLYLDGALAATANSVTVNTRADGGELLVAQATGDFDELAVYDYALSAARIQARVDAAALAETTTTLEVPTGDWIEDTDLTFTATVDAPAAEFGTPTGSVELWDDNTLLDTATLEATGTATFTVQLTAGNHRIYARYTGDATFVASRSRATTKQATQAAPTETALVVDPAPSVYGQPVTLTATVSSPQHPDVTPTGTVRFLAGGAEVGRADLTDGTATLTITPPAAGTVDYVAAYDGDINHAASASATTPHTIAAGATTLAVTGPATGRAVYSQNVTFTADVSPVAPASGTPTGTVTFYVDGNEIDTKPVVGARATTTALNAVAVGEHVVTATFAPASPNWAASATNATPLSHQVTPAGTATLLNADRTVIEAGDTFTFTGTVNRTSPAQATPTGEAQLLIDGTPHSTVTLTSGVATFTVESLDLGAHTAVVAYPGTANFAASTSNQLTVTVGSASTVTVTTNHDTTRYGQALTVTATVGGGQTTATGTVVFKAGTAPLGVFPLDQTGAARITTSLLEPGTHSLTAEYRGDANLAPSTSTPVTVTVERADTTVAVTTGPNPSGRDTNVTLTADIDAVAPGGGGPAGFVTFYRDADPTPIATATVSGGEASATTTFASVGEFQITAAYGGSNRYNPSTSAAHEHHVRPDTTLTVAADPSPSAYGQPLTLTAAAASDAGTPEGTVTFLLDGAEIGATSTADGTAQLVVDDLTVGDHDISARFASDSWGPSTAQTVTHTTTGALAEVDVWADPIVADVGEPVTLHAEITSTAPNLPAPTGFVTFDIDGEPLATVPIRNGAATFSTVDLAVGGHTIDAHYGGDLRYGSASADPAAIVAIRQATSELDLTIAPNPAAPDTTIAATAQLALTGAGNAELDGDVEFFLDGTPLATVQLTDGTATTSFLSPASLGDYTLTATYTGNDNIKPTTTDAALAVREPVNVTLTPPAGITALGGPAAFEVHVTPAGTNPQTPTGTVVLNKGGQPLATAQLQAGTATLTVADLLAGTHDLTATYQGDATFAQGTSVAASHTVSSGTTVVHLTSPQPASGQGRPAVFTATIEGSASFVGPTGFVTFSIDGAPVGTSTVNWSSQASISLAGLPLGEHTVTAVYGGDTNYEPATATPLAHQIVPALDAAFTVTPSRGSAPLAAAFTATGQNPNANQWIWDFGNGARLTGPTVNYTFTQPGIYTVTLNIYDGIQHDWSQQKVTVSADRPLDARAGGDLIIMAGERIRLDGGDSEPVFGISQYLWTLGDGTTKTGESITHTYTEPGTYTGELKVISAQTGATDTDTFTVTVLDNTPDVLEITTRNNANQLLEGVDVIVEHPIHGRYTAVSGADGIARIAGLADGTYTIYAAAPNYLPVASEVTVSDGAGALTVQLAPGAVGQAELSVDRLDTIEEILAAGVDPTAPGNEVIYEFETNIGIGTHKTYVNRDGNIVSGGTVISARSGGGGSYRGTGTVVRTGDDDGFALVWIVIPIRSRYLKEFFDVQLTVTNGATEPFRFTNGQAILNLPDGMSLAPTTQPQTLVQDMADIPSGQAQSVSWIVRGDEPGDHHLSADYTGVLDPIGTTLHLTANASAPVNVWGGLAGRLTVNVEEHATSTYPYQVQLSLTNVSDTSIINPAIEIGDPVVRADSVPYLHQPEQQRSWARASIAPGETWFIDDVVLFPFRSGEINLEESFATGHQIPVEFTGFEPPEDFRLRDGESVEGVNPKGFVVLEWEHVPGATSYEIWSTTKESTPFTGPGTVVTASAPGAEAGHWRHWVPGTEGSENLFAVRPIYGAELGDARHNVVTGEAGTETSALVDVSTDCQPGGDYWYLDITERDPYYEISEYRISAKTPGADDFVTLEQGTWPEGLETVTKQFDKEDEVAPELTEYPPGTIMRVELKNAVDGDWGRADSTTASLSCVMDLTIAPRMVFGHCVFNEAVEWTELPAQCEADPVNTATGNLYDAATDARYPAPGIPFDFLRSYNSLDERDGPLGVGWTHPYNTELLFEETTVWLRRGDGRQMPFGAAEDGTFTPQPGVRGTLTAADGIYTYTAPDRQEWTFDAAGRLTSAVDASGQGLTFTHDPGGQLNSMSDAAGRTYTFTNDPDGRLTRLDLPDGTAITYTYTGDHLTSVIDQAGATTTYRYDNGKMVEETDRNNNRVHLTSYGTDGRVTAQLDPFGHETTFSWDPATETSVMTDTRGGQWTSDYQGNILHKRTDPLGNDTVYGYNESGSLTDIFTAGGTHLRSVYDDHGNLLTRTVSGLGLTDTYLYDDADNLTSHTDRRGATTSYTYDAAGRVTTIDGPDDHLATLSYDSRGLVQTQTDPSGATTTYSYDNDGNIASITDPAGARLSFTHDDLGRLLTSTSRRGHTTSLAYDATGRMVQLTAADGATSRYGYDAEGNLTSLLSPTGVPTTRTYNAGGQLIAEQTGTSAPTTLTYDTRGQLATSTSPGGHTTTNTYDLARRLTSVTDPNGNTTTYRYDASGNLTQQTDPTGAATTYDYDQLDRVIAVTDPAGQRVAYTYEPGGNIATVTDPAGATTAFSYDQIGRRTTATDALAQTTTTSYDTRGLISAVTDPAGGRTTYTYDANRRIASMVDPRGNAAGADPNSYRTLFAHDADGNPTAVTDANGHTTTASYDPVGRRLSTTDPAGRTSSYGYDADGRLTSATTPGGQPGEIAATTYTYDTNGDLVAITDPRGGTRTWSYDADHRVSAAFGASGERWDFGYDANGNRTSVVDANATTAGDPTAGTTTFTYDARGLLVGISYSRADTPDVTYTYDPAGRLVAMADGEGSASYSYDPAGRLGTVNRGGDAFTYGYDTLSRLNARTYPDGTRVDLGYDAAGRLATVSGPGGNVTYDYDPAGYLDQTTYPNGVVQDATWDPAGQLTQLATIGPDGPIADATRTFDPAGNPTAETSLWGPSTFGYDDQDRLTAACLATDCGTDPTLAYTYDTVGNRLTQNTPEGTRSFTYDASDRVDRATGLNPAEFTYDANGNLLYDGLFFYTYDQANRLMRVDQAGTGAPGTITGTVDDGTSPLEGIEVTAYAGMHRIATATTAADGTYSLTGLAPGSYRIRFDDPGGTHRSEWNDNATSVTDATEVTISADQTLTIDATLQPANPTASITGTVTAAGSPVEDAAVLVISAPDPGDQPHLPEQDQPGTSPAGLTGLDLDVDVNDVTGAPNGPPVLAGQPVVWTYTVTNTGLAALGDIAVTDTGGAVITCPVDDGDATIATLEPGATVDCTATSTAGPSPYTHTASAAAASGTSATAPARYQGIAACTITGTAGDDTINGTSGDDIICGLGGNDTINAKQGNDTILGGTGDDRIEGGYGDDVLDGGDGSDLLFGNQHSDVLLGGEGDNRLEGGYGPDVIISGAGNDTIEGNQEADWIHAGPGNDDIKGGYGPDTIFAGAGDDTVDGNQEIDIIVGGEGDDTLNGGYGADRIYGGPGTDSLDGRQQADTLDGGPGTDTFDGGLGANHIFEGGPFEAHLTTTTDGTWSLAVPEGRYLVLVWAAGYQPAGWQTANSVAGLTEILVDPTETAVGDIDLTADPNPPAIPPPPAGTGTGGGDPELVATYTYDGSGTRLSKTTTDETIEFLWDTNGLLPELAQERTATGTTRSFTHGIGPVSMTDTDGAYFYHLDPVGSVAALTDHAGDTQWTYRYEPFGAALEEQQHAPGAPQNPLRYTGQQLDDETGLYYLRARYYDPTQGRFTQVDPIPHLPGTNYTTPYAYVANQPTSLVDPSGLYSQAPTLLWNQDQLANIQQCWQDGGELFFVESHAGANGCGTFEFGGCAISWMWTPICEYQDEIITAIDTVAGFLPGFDCLSAITWDRTAARAAFCLADLLPGSDVLKYAGRYGDELTALLFRRGDELAQASRFDDLVPALCRVNSFSGDTQVLMADGSSRAISNVKVGDWVAAALPAGGYEPRQVTRVWTHEGPEEIVRLQSASGHVDATQGHMIWDWESQEWRPAGDFGPGSSLADERGQPVPLGSADTESRVSRVWNLTIEGNHTYFVGLGASWVRVHNCGSDPATYFSYKELRAEIQAAGLSGQGVGLEAHHLLEKRFAGLVGVPEDDILSVALTPAWHRNVGGMGTNIDNMITTELARLGTSPGAASIDDVWKAHKNVYSSLGYSDWADALYEAYFRGAGVPY